MNREERRRQNKAEADRLAQETLDNMKAKREARKESIQTKWENADKGKVIKIGIIVVSAVLSLIGILAIISANNRVDVLNGQIAEMQTQIATKQSEIDAIDLTPIEQQLIQDTMNTCLQQGSEVADLQNQYYNVLDMQKYGFSENNVNEIERISGELSKYFGGSNEDATAYWFTTQESDHTKFTWQFETTYGFHGDTIDVMWTCYKNADSSGALSDELLAYAVGVYNVATGKFTNVNFTVTNCGKALQGYSTGTDCDEQPKVDMTIDADGDGKTDLNVDTDGDGVPDTNIDADGNGIIDVMEGTDAQYERDEDRGEETAPTETTTPTDATTTTSATVDDDDDDDDDDEPTTTTTAFDSYEQDADRGEE